MWRILDFLLSCGGNYTEDRIPELQRIILVALSTNQHVIRIGADGEIKYWACWWHVADNDLESVLDYQNRTMPADVTKGRNVYVAEVASRGEAKEMIRRIKQNARRENGRAFWHKPHRGGQLLGTVKHAR